MTLRSLAFADNLLRPSLALQVAAILSKEITLLAPTDEAFGKVGDSLKNIPKDVIFATVLYHVLQGTYPSQGADDAFHVNNHTIAMSLLTNQTYVNLPGGMPQAVVLSRNDDGYPVVVSAFGNVSFAQKSENISLGGLSLHGINGLLTIPLNLTATLAQTKRFNSLLGAATKANVAGALTSSPGLTIFAPNDAAFTAAGAALGPVEADQMMFANVLGNHVVNGTVIYTADLAEQAAKNAADASMKQADGSILVSKLISSTGAAFNITQDSTGSFWVNSNQTQARIVLGGSDIPYNAGVIHTIDKVLWNTNSDPSALSSAVQSNNQNSGAMASSQTGGSSTGGQNTAHKAQISLPVVGGFCSLAALLIGAGALLY